MAPFLWNSKRVIHVLYFDGDEFCEPCATGFIDRLTKKMMEVK